MTLQDRMVYDLERVFFENMHREYKHLKSRIFCMAVVKTVIYLLSYNRKSEDSKAQIEIKIVDGDARFLRVSVNQFISSFCTQ